MFLSTLAPSVLGSLPIMVSFVHWVLGSLPITPKVLGSFSPSQGHWVLGSLSLVVPRALGPLPVLESQSMPAGIVLLLISTFLVFRPITWIWPRPAIVCGVLGSLPYLLTRLGSQARVPALRVLGSLVPT